MQQLIIIFNTGKKGLYHMDTEDEIKVRRWFYLMIHRLHEKKDLTRTKRKQIISMLKREKKIT